MSLFFLFACWLMVSFTTGMYWFMQVMHYPLFSRVGPKEFNDYYQQYRRREPWAVHLPAILSLVLTIGLIAFRPWSIPSNYLYILSAFLGFNILLTFLLIVPHNNILLQHGYSYMVIQKLNAINWLRTVLWTIASIYLSWLVSFLINFQAI